MKWILDTYNLSNYKTINGEIVILIFQLFNGNIIHSFFNDFSLFQVKFVKITFKYFVFQCKKVSWTSFPAKKYNELQSVIFRTVLSLSPHSFPLLFLGGGKGKKTIHCRTEDENLWLIYKKVLIIPHQINVL